ncbi:MAG: hypothetical protein JWR53_667 [Glaciihabitans sp.]|nr:hypothetical protein [Glaciihabitans sp.]
MTSAETTTTPAPAAATRTLSILSFVLGLASIVASHGGLIPIAAIIVGIFAYRTEPTGRALSVWGIVISALVLVGWLVVAVLGLAFLLPFGLLHGDF